MLLEYYRNYLTSSTLRDTTIKSYVNNVKPFFIYLDIDNIRKISNITIENVYQYIDYLNNYSIVTKQDRMVSLRMLLNWLFEMKYISFSGRKILPIIVKHHDTTIPSYYTQDECKKLLDSIDTSTYKGCRDYAILCIITYYGLRISDVKKLKFNDIDFEKNTISIIQQKTDKLVTLPLLDAVKYPVLDYAKNFRGISEYEEIFLSANPPHPPFTCAGFCLDVTNYLKNANVNINGRKHGPHALRHSLTNSLLKEGVSFKVISEILGHSDLVSTQAYASIDTSGLKELSLEVPIC